MNTKGHEPRQRMDYEPPGRKGHSTSLFAWVLAIAAAFVLGSATVAMYWLHLNPVFVFWLVFFGFMLVGIPAGIWYGTQDKDYWQ